jgi:hypothetical protein
MLDELGFSWELPSEMKRRLKIAEINTRNNLNSLKELDDNSYNSPGPKATPYILNEDGSINSNYDNDNDSNGKNDGISKHVSGKEKKKSKTSDFMKKWELNLVRVCVLLFCSQMFFMYHTILFSFILHFLILGFR